MLNDSGKFLIGRKFKQIISYWRDSMDYSATQRNENQRLHQSTILIEDYDTGHYQYATVYNARGDSIYCGADIAFDPGTRVKIKIANQAVKAAAYHYQCEVKWCRESNGGSSTHDYGLGLRIFKAILE